MKIRNAVLFVGTLLCVGCAPSAQDDGLGHHHHDHSHAGNNGNSEEIVLSVKEANRFGVYSQMVKPQDFNDVIKVSGQVLSALDDQSIVVAPSSGILTFAHGIIEGKKVTTGNAIASVSARGISGGDANEASRITYESAKAEYERVTPLHNDGIVSTKDYNAIKQAYEQAKAAYTGNSSGSTASAISNGVITKLLVKQGEYVAVGQPIAVISGNTRLTLRADMPEKYYNFLPLISTANIRPAYIEGVISLSNLNGKLVSSSATTSQPGYIPVFFTFDNDGSVIPGTFVEVYLIGATRKNVIVLPVDAVTEQQGKFYVYVKLDDECYEKRLVTLGGTDGQSYEIKSGLTRKDEVVSRGAIIVKLAEASGAIPAGHSH